MTGTDTTRAVNATNLHAGAQTNPEATGTVKQFFMAPASGWNAGGILGFVQGRESNPGTVSRPVATLQKAHDRVKAWLAASLPEPT